MANDTNDKPQRPKPNESENQPGFEPEDEPRRGAQPDQTRGNADRRKDELDPQRKDDVASPPIDPKIARGEGDA
jgi:hypothetical protein